MGKVDYIVRQTTDDQIIGVYDCTYDEPSITFSRIPRAKLNVPNEGGVYGRLLDIGKEVTITREKQLVFTGIVESLKPKKTNANSDLEVTLIEKSYHFLRRQFCHNYDVNGDGLPIFNAATGGGETINPWSFNIFRNPNARVDVYGNAPAVDGVRPDQVIRMALQDQYIRQERYNSVNMFAQENIGDYNISNFSDNKTGADFVGQLDNAVIAEPESIILLSNDPNIFINPDLTSVELLFIGQGESNGELNYNDSSPNGRHGQMIGTPGTYADSYLRYGVGPQFKDGTFLRRVNNDMNSTGNISVTLRFKIDSIGTAQWIAMVGSDNFRDSTFDVSWEIFVNANGMLAYQHGVNNGTAAWRANSSQYQNTAGVNKYITTGEHTLTLTRNTSTRTLIMYVDGDEFINATYVGGDDPSIKTPGTNGTTLFIAGTRACWIANEYNRLKGAITEFRYWKSVVSQATLNQIVNPTDNTYDHTLAGGEFVAYYMDTALSVGNLGVSVANDLARTYSPVTMTRVPNYNGSGLIAWKGTYTFAGPDKYLSYKLLFPVNSRIKLFYSKIIATASDSKFPVLAGTIDEYATPVDAAAGYNGEENWVDIDVFSFTKLDAIEKVRLMTENGTSQNSTPFWDVWFGTDGLLNFQEERGIDVGKIYSFEYGNLETIGHEFFGAELAYQTVAYGVGSGDEQSRIVTKRPFDIGGLYDSSRDPGENPLYSFKLGNSIDIPRITIGNSRVSQAFKVPLPVTNKDITFKFNFSRSGPSQNGTVRFNLASTRTGTTWQLSKAVGILASHVNEDSVTFTNVTLAANTTYYFTIAVEGTTGGHQFTVEGTTDAYPYGNAWNLDTEQSFRMIFGLSYIDDTRAYQDIPRQIRFIDSTENSGSGLLHKARVFHKLHRDPIETLDVELAGEFIRYFNVGDRVSFDDIETRTNALLRVVEITRKFDGQKEEVKVKLGEAPKSVSERLNEAQNNQHVVALKSTVFKNKLLVEEDNGTNGVNEVETISFASDMFNLSATGVKGVTVALDLDMGEW